MADSMTPTESAAVVIEPGAAVTAVERAAWQEAIFAEVPSRAEVIRLQATTSDLRPVRVYVHRNHTFESLMLPIDRFLAFAGIRATFDLSAFDDALTEDPNGPADAEMIWYDIARLRSDLSVDAICGLVSGVVERRRAATDASLLVAAGMSTGDRDRRVVSTLQASLRGVPSTVVFDVPDVLGRLGPSAFDERVMALTGSGWSDAASMTIARDLAFKWLPTLTEPRLKLIALDADDTLYAGVLGEDGVTGVLLTPAHRALQQDLVSLRASGVLLALVSRNDPHDVDELLRSRSEFPLRREHFSAIAVSWDAKATGIRAILGSLGLGPESALLVDDNMGEIASVTSAIPEIRTLHASDPELTTRALRAYPGLHGYTGNDADRVRIADTAAQARRHAIRQSSGSEVDYVKALGIELAVDLHPRESVGRLAALSQKTNQFNTSLLRLSEAAVARRLADERCRTVAIGMRDRLADSGIIGAVFAHADGEVLQADGIAVSCRALGRGIETVMLAAVLARLAEEEACTSVRIKVTPGPRNEPARRWADSLADASVSDEIPIDRLVRAGAGLGDLATVDWSGPPTHG